jgi:hypothetical protein
MKKIRNPKNGRLILYGGATFNKLAKEGVINPHTVEIIDPTQQLTIANKQVAREKVRDIVTSRVEDAPEDSDLDSELDDLFHSLALQGVKNNIKKSSSAGLFRIAKKEEPLSNEEEDTSSESSGTEGEE